MAITAEQRLSLAQAYDRLQIVDCVHEDPELALYQANKMRGQPGGTPAVADLLYQAGVAFIRRAEWPRAVDALLESIELLERMNTKQEEQVGAILLLGYAFYRMEQWESAFRMLQLARPRG